MIFLLDFLFVILDKRILLARNQFAENEFFGIFSLLNVKTRSHITSASDGRGMVIEGWCSRDGARGLVLEGWCSRDGARGMVLERW